MELRRSGQELVRVPVGIRSQLGQQPIEPAVDGGPHRRARGGAGGEPIHRAIPPPAVVGEGGEAQAQRVLLEVHLGLVGERAEVPSDGFEAPAVGIEVELLVRGEVVLLAAKDHVEGVEGREAVEVEVALDPGREYSMGAAVDAVEQRVQRREVCASIFAPPRELAPVARPSGGLRRPARALEAPGEHRARHAASAAQQPLVGLGLEAIHPEVGVLHAHPHWVVFRRKQAFVSGEAEDHVFLQAEGGDVVEEVEHAHAVDQRARFGADLHRLLSADRVPVPTPLMAHLDLVDLAVEAEQGLHVAPLLLRLRILDEGLRAPRTDRELEHREGRGLWRFGHAQPPQVSGQLVVNEDLEGLEVDRPTGIGGAGVALKAHIRRPRVGARRRGER